MILLSLAKKLVLAVAIVLIVVVYLFAFSVRVKFGSSIFNLNEISSWCMNENHYSVLVTVVVSIVALALPLSISVVTQSKDQNFNSEEMARYFYNEPRYLAVKRSVITLAVLVCLSYFQEVWFPIVIITTLMTIYVLWEFYHFMNLVEKYVSDFAGIVIEREKERINGIF